MKLNCKAAVVDIVEEMRSRVWVVRERLGFRDWCTANISLRTTEAAASAGPYSTAKVESMSRLWEMFLDSDDWGELILVKGSQSTATTHALLGISRRVAESPVNTIYTIHSVDEARNISGRLGAFLEDCPQTGGIMSEVPSNDKTTLALRLPAMNLWFTGAHSAGALASKPGVGLVIVDEVDKHPTIKGEAPTIELLRQRMKTVPNAKLAAFSTPTHEEGQIWSEAKDGSGHRDHVPCPYCQHMQWLNPERLRWGHCQDLAGMYDLEKVLTDTRYQCEGCGKEIEESHKAWMYERGEWRPTNYKEVERDGEMIKVPGWQPRKMSAYHNDLCAMWAGSSWGDLAVEAISAHGSPGKTHSLLNNRWGLPFIVGGTASIKEEDVWKLRGPYKRGAAPWAPHLVTFCADTQDDAYKWVLCAWNEKGDCAVVDWGMTLTWSDVMERARDGARWNGENVVSKFCLVDEGGHRTREVRRNVLPLRPWFFASKGLGGIQVKTTLAWRDFGVDKEGMETVPVLTYDDDSFKRLLYRERIYKGSRAGHRKSEAQLQDPTICFPEDLESEFVAELCSERLEKVGKKWKWETHGANDFGDALKMNYIAHAQIGHMVSTRRVEEG